MKKELPVPLIVVTVVAAASLAAFLLFRSAAGPAEFSPPKMEKTIPKYIFDGMTPQMQQQMRAEGYSVTESTPDAMAGNQPQAPGP